MVKFKIKKPIKTRDYWFENNAPDPLLRSEYAAVLNIDDTAKSMELTPRKNMYEGYIVSDTYENYLESYYKGYYEALALRTELGNKRIKAKKILGSKRAKLENWEKYDLLMTYMPNGLLVKKSFKEKKLIVGIGNVVRGMKNKAKKTYNNITTFIKNKKEQKKAKTKKSVGYIIASPFRLVGNLWKKGKNKIKSLKNKSKPIIIDNRNQLNQYADEEINSIDFNTDYEPEKTVVDFNVDNKPEKSTVEFTTYSPQEKFEEANIRDYPEDEIIDIDFKEVADEKPEIDFDVNPNRNFQFYKSSILDDARTNVSLDRKQPGSIITDTYPTLRKKYPA